MIFFFLNCFIKEGRPITATNMKNDMVPTLATKRPGNPQVGAR